MADNIGIDPLSIIPLNLDCLLHGNIIATGTGFAVIRNGNHYLITNWHIVTCRDPNTYQPLSRTGIADPDAIGIWYHDANRLGTWHRKIEHLIDPSSGNHLWIEHPLGRQIDVIALQLPIHNDVKVYSLDTSLAHTDLIVSPSDPVSIVGFPYGIAAAGKFPIWKTGHIASDVDLNYEDKPVFLIDATTTPGMSGSPVIARRLGMHRSSTGVRMGGDIIRFLGIYSGRIHLEADIGMVWKPSILGEILHS